MERSCRDEVCLVLNVSNIDHTIRFGCHKTEGRTTVRPSRKNFRRDAIYRVRLMC